MVISGRLPSRRAVAAGVKLCGRRLERRWPFIPRAEGKDLNLGFDDLLEFQYARSRDFAALVIGAFDGVTNDPTTAFIRKIECRAIFVEPQPGPYGRLRDYLSGVKNIEILNVAIDEVSGFREIYCVPPGIDDLPAWAEQLASFSREHLLKHESRAPGLSKHIQTMKVPTLSFADLVEKFSLRSLDVLQIDTEGMDAILLKWFPFERIKPGVLHYEVAHMSAEQQAGVRMHLSSCGYVVLDANSPEDEMAILF